MFNGSEYALVLFVHIGAAIALVGQTLGAPLVRALLREAATPADLRRWLGFARRSARWNLPVSLALLGSGVYLGASGWWTEPWFHLAVAAWVVNALLVRGVVQPAAGALMAAAVGAGDGPISAEIEQVRRSTAWALATQAMLANDCAILWVMIAKPGTAGSVTLILIAHVLLGGAWLVRHRSRGSVATRDLIRPAMDTRGAR